MKSPYRFTVLRYVHDVMTEEFINVGVVVYCRTKRFLGVQCNARYRRLSDAFCSVNGGQYREIIRYVERCLREEAEHMAEELAFDGLPDSVLEITAKVLPPDDSSLQFSPERGGLTVDPARTLDDLYCRFVEQYAPSTGRGSRSDEDVWNVYKEPLARLDLLAHFEPHKVEGKDYAYRFQNAWKNERWHLYEPVSFDLLEDESITEKAVRWVGRIDNLVDGKDPDFHLVMLLGSPTNSNHQPAFVRAENILNKMQCKRTFVREDEAEAFAEDLAREIESHG